MQKLLDAQLLVSAQSMYESLKVYVASTTFANWNQTHTYGANLERYVETVNALCQDMSDKNLLANVTTIMETINILQPNLELANLD